MQKTLKPVNTNTKKEQSSSSSSPLINDKIRAPQVQLITHGGENIGIVSRLDALRRAEAAGLDLVMISEEGREGVPVVKIMDFGKVLYEKKKKQTESKKHQKVIQIKEIKLSPKIGEHDYQTKIKQALQFLHEGKRVKVTLFFKGREIVTKEERGTEMFDKVTKSLEAACPKDELIQEKDAKLGQLWSRVYYLKQGK